MPTYLQPHILLDRTNRRAPVQGPSSAPYPPDAAGVKAANLFTDQTDIGRVHAQDPFAYYKAFLNTNTNVSSAWGVNYDGNTHHPSLEAQSSHYGGDQQQFRVRPIPYNVAVRFANRSNGIPLSTIIEQGSYSTLNSHGSPPSVSQYHSVNVNDSISPNLYPHRRSRSLDESTLRRIEEDTYQEQHGCEDVNLHAPLDDDCENFDKQFLAATPIGTGPRDRQLSGYSLTSNTNNDLGSRGLKRFLRGVLHDIGASRHNGSRSSSVTDAHASDCRGSWLDTKEDSSRAQYRNNRVSNGLEKRNGPQVSTFGNSLPLSSSPPSQDLPEFKARNRTSLSINKEADSSARYNPPMVHILPVTSDFDVVSRLSPHFLQPPFSSSSPSEHVPPNTPRDVAGEDTLVESCTQSHCSRDDLSARYIFDGVPLSRINAPSLREYDRAREASVCSTISTTYSGTVLGIDLDLHQEYPHSSIERRSPTPPCFAPSQTGGTSKLEYKQKNDTNKIPHTITSSALPILLPLAAASGIVFPNRATPKLSFFSPSGNLIQLEHSSSPAPSSILPYRSKSLPTSVYNEIISNPVYEPPVRPAPVPLTTPPTTTAHLPAHLRHHHNYQHPAHSHIIPQTPEKSLEISNGGTHVKGCGGVVRTKSLRPHSRVKQPGSTKRRTRWSSCSISKSEVPYFVRRPSLQLHNGTAKGRVNDLETREEDGASKPHVRVLGTLEPLTGHILRVCFCQPDLVDEEADGAAHARSKKRTEDRRIERDHNVLLTTRGVSVQKRCALWTPDGSARFKQW
jgi:hypothetical protein